MALLEDPEIERRLGDLPGWEREGEAITKTFERGDFVGSVRFIDSLVEPAESMKHLPFTSAGGRDRISTAASPMISGLRAEDINEPSARLATAEVAM